MSMLKLWETAVGYFWRPELPWALGFTYGLGLVLLRFLRADRKAIINSLELYAFCLFGKFVSAVLEAFGLYTGAEIVHEIFVVGSGLIMIHLTGLLLFRLILPLIRLRTPRIIQDLLVFVGYIAWVLVRLRLAGMDLASLVTTSALITAVVAFSMQDTLGNTMGGLLLQLESSLKIGDWITISGVSGRISEIRWRYTAVETRDGETVVFPNSVLMKNPFTVISSPTQRCPEWRRWLWFNVHCSVPPGRVIELAVAAVTAADIPNVAREPEPGCVLMEFGSGFSRYALRYWLVDAGPDSPTDSAVRMCLFAALQRAGIEFAITEHSVHMVVDSRQRRERSQAHDWQRRQMVLRSADLFNGLTEGEIAIMAEGLTYAPFANGDVIIRQGVAGDSLYLLAEGEVDVWIETHGQLRRHVATLGPGEVFGEVGMMTGEPRRATLTAKHYAQCYRLDRTSFEQVIHSRPEIAEEIARVLATRERKLASFQEDDRMQLTSSEVTQRAQSILGKMRKFFGFR